MNLARAAAAALLLTLVAPAARGSAYLPVAEVRPGMRGVALTVIQGTTIEPFSVEIVSVLKGAGPAGDLVLIRAGGPVIERTGGIAAGMSGSPVFVGGRLLGAIGYGWTFADHTLGLVTPIADMLRSARPAASYRLPSPVRIAGRPVSRIAVAAPRDAAAINARSGGVVVALAPAATPLIAGGLGPRGLEALRLVAAEWGVRPVQGGGGAVARVGAFAPGAAISALLVRGDVTIGAIGTLTWRSGDRVLAFGHQFLNKGRVAYLLAGAEIHSVVRSIEAPFKIGSVGPPAGTVTSDRAAAIGGRLGVLPPVFGVRVEVHDEDEGHDQTLAMSLVRDPEIGPSLALVGILDAVDRGLERIGEGTAQVRISARGAGLPETVVRENAFYSGRDVAVAAMGELPQMLRLLFANEFTAVAPIDLRVALRVRRARMTASIVDAEPLAPAAPRGGTLPVRVLLRPFQGQETAEVIDVPVPAWFPAGPATVIVRAGGRPAPTETLQNLLLAEPQGAAGDLRGQIAAFTGSERNTDLVVELVAGGGRGAAGGAPAAARGTAWVLRGRLSRPIVVTGAP